MGLNLPYLILVIVVVFGFVVVIGHLRQKQGVPTILTYHHLLSGYMGEIVSCLFPRSAATEQHYP